MATRRRGTVLLSWFKSRLGLQIQQLIIRSPSVSPLESRVPAMRTAGTTSFCILPDDGSPVRPWCLVDISSGGTCLQVETPDSIVDFFMLVQRGEIIKLCCDRVAWRPSLQAGVKFERPADQRC